MLTKLGRKVTLTLLVRTGWSCLKTQHTYHMEQLSHCWECICRKQNQHGKEMPASHLYYSILHTSQAMKFSAKLTK